MTLSGHVESYNERVAAVEAVRRLRGVKAIADEIDVRYAFEKKTADDQIAKRALDILEWDTIVPSAWIKVTVHNGQVTLTGDVDWFYQKKAAEDDVRKLSGVTSVINNLNIRPHTNAGDIKRKIEEALKRHAEVESDAIVVVVKQNDRVVLEGNVHNWEERTAVENAAWSALGVRVVEDRLVIR